MNITTTNFIFYICLLTYLNATTELYSNTWLVELKKDMSDTEVNLLTESLGFKNFGKIFPNDKKYEFKNNGLPESFKFPSIQEHQALLKNPNVKYAEQQVLIPVSFESESGDAGFNDPYYDQAWHLLEESSTRESQTTMNIQEAWRRGYTGKGVVVAVVDTGVEKTHPDLRENYDSLASRDVQFQLSDPDPQGDNHGTMCAGVIAAGANNSYCSVGVAYNSRIGGIRVGTDFFTAIHVARAWSHRLDYIDVYSNSWSFSDNIFYQPHSLEIQAISEGILKGREGKGSIYVIAGGNYHSSSYSYARNRAATDGHKNLLETLVINAVSSNNRQVTYARECACVIVSAYSGSQDADEGVITTNLRGTCTDKFSGTSAATPMAAGVIALLLEANSNLTWRDVQHITILSANASIIRGEPFILNGAGLNYSTWIGFGLMDALSMVKLGETWTNVPPMRWIHSNQQYINRAMDREKFEDTVSFGPRSDRECRQASRRTPCYIESVLLVVNIATESRRYLNVRFWGESVWGSNAGTWKIAVKQLISGYAVHFKSYSLIIFGTHDHPYGGRSIAELKNSNDTFNQDHDHP